LVIFAFCLAAAKPNFKWMVLSRLKELEGVPFTGGKVWNSSFHPNWNHLKIKSIAPVMIKKMVAKGQIVQI
jgi:hypothetical protein